MGTMISVLSLLIYVRTSPSSQTHNKNNVEGMKEHETTISSHGKSVKLSNHRAESDWGDAILSSCL